MHFTPDNEMDFAEAVSKRDALLGTGVGYPDDTPR